MRFSESERMEALDARVGKSDVAVAPGFVMARCTNGLK
jgi:hypothetical protein